jgi:hypothetical protein
MASHLRRHAGLTMNIPAQQHAAGLLLTGRGQGQAVGYSKFAAPLTARGDYGEPHGLLRVSAQLPETASQLATLEKCYKPSGRGEVTPPQHRHRFRALHSTQIERTAALH